MTIDFSFGPLRRYLWDHLSELLDPPPHRSGISNTWTSGRGYEGFDTFSLELRKFPGGQSNPTFLLVIRLSPPPHARQQDVGNEHRFVLRKKPANVKVSSAHAVEREFRVLRALRDTDVPVPRARMLCDDPAVIGTPFYLMDFVNGRVFTDATMPSMKRSDRAAAYASAAETLARIHRIDFFAVGLGDFGRSTGSYLTRQVATLERVARKQAEDAGPIEGFEEVVEDLRELCSSAPDRVTLVHGDYRIDNLVFHPEEPRVVAVLDWELSTLGHPIADLASLCFLHNFTTPRVEAPERGGRRRTPSPLTGLRRKDLCALGIPEQSELVGVYRRFFGSDRLGEVAGPDLVELGLAFVFFKMAVIAHGVRSRLARGVASSDSASQVSSLVPMLLSLAKEQILKLKVSEGPDVGDDINDEEYNGDKERRQVGATADEGGGGRQRPPPKAVLFDVGGVFTDSPLVAISRFERGAHPRPLPPSYVGIAITAAGEDGLFQRLERGEERLGERFLEQFAEYLRSDHAKRAYVKYVERKAGNSPLPSASGSSVSSSMASVQKARSSLGLAAAGISASDSMKSPASDGPEMASEKVEEARRAVAAVESVDVLELFRVITTAAAAPVPEMIAAAEALQSRGLKIAAVSNDFLVEEGFTALGRAKLGVGRDKDAPRVPGETDVQQASHGVYRRLPAMCDAVVLSSALGHRKPGKRIYERACQALGVSACEAVFVDDIQANLRAAEALGMQTVWVRPGSSTGVWRAIAQLQTITGVPLMGGGGGYACLRQPAGKL